MATQTAPLDKQGRLVIPADFRRQMGWKAGERLTLMLVGSEMRVLSRRQALDEICAEVRKHIPAGVSLAGELIRERRQEAARDEAEAASPALDRTAYTAKPRTLRVAGTRRG